MVLFSFSAILMYVIMWALFFIPIVMAFVLYDTVIAIMKRIFTK